MRRFEIAHKEEELLAAEEQVALGQRHIHELEQLILRLQKDGHPIREAESLLLTFRDSQKLHEQHRDTVIGELAALGVMVRL